MFFQVHHVQQRLFDLIVELKRAVLLLLEDHTPVAAVVAVDHHSVVVAHREIPQNVHKDFAAVAVVVAATEEIVLLSYGVAFVAAGQEVPVHVKTETCCYCVVDVLVLRVRFRSVFGLQVVSKGTVFSAAAAVEVGSPFLLGYESHCLLDVVVVVVVVPIGG